MAAHCCVPGGQARTHQAGASAAGTSLKVRGGGGAVHARSRARVHGGVCNPGGGWGGCWEGGVLQPAGWGSSVHPACVVRCVLWRLVAPPSWVYAPSSGIAHSGCRSAQRWTLPVCSVSAPALPSRSLISSQYGSRGVLSKFTTKMDDTRQKRLDEMLAEAQAAVAGEGEGEWCLPGVLGAGWQGEAGRLVPPVL